MVDNNNDKNYSNNYNHDDDKKKKIIISFIEVFAQFPQRFKWALQIWK